MSLYAAMMKIEVRRASARVRARFFGGGSIGAETIATGCEGIECELELESHDEPSKVAKLARLSEAGCFVVQSLRKPTEVRIDVRLNGRSLGLP